MGARVGAIWKFVSKPANLAVFIALASGIAYLWDKFEPKPKPKPATTAAGQQATASGGPAVNATGAAQVIIGSSSSASAALSADPVGAGEPVPISGQRAEAREGAAAVNASDHARVKINAAP